MMVGYTWGLSTRLGIAGYTWLIRQVRLEGLQGDSSCQLLEALHIERLRLRSFKSSINVQVLEKNTSTSAMSQDVCRQVSLKAGHAFLISTAKLSADMPEKTLFVSKRVTRRLV